jgi:hypothetical protein
MKVTSSQTVLWCMIVFALPLMLMCVIGAVPAKGESMKEFYIGRVSLMVPQELTIRRSSPTGDFEIVVVLRGDLAILNAYFGNAPDFPSRHCRSRVVKDTKVGRIPAREVVCRADPSANLFRELLIELREVGDWPRFVHFTGRSRA